MSYTNDAELFTIGQQIRSSLEALTTKLEAEQEEGSFEIALKDAAQRFDLWGVNLGLYATGHSSLEYRIGDAPSIYTYTKNALLDLQKYLSIGEDVFQI